MAGPQEQDLTGDNPSQSRAAQSVDRAVLGTTPQTARFRVILFIVLFILVAGSVFYFLNQG